MQIKRLVHNLLIKAILSVISVVGFISNAYASFNTGVYCNIRGYLYYDGHNVSAINRSDYCFTVSERLRENVIMLWSNTHWVVIVIPRDEYIGLIVFQYKWGADYGYINGKVIYIDWGYVMRG